MYVLLVFTWSASIEDIHCALRKKKKKDINCANFIVVVVFSIRFSFSPLRPVDNRICGEGKHPVGDSEASRDIVREGHKAQWGIST